jgi:hypothetical protein
MYDTDNLDVEAFRKALLAIALNPNRGRLSGHDALEFVVVQGH